LANFLNAVAGILHFILMLYIWFTEPVLAPVRKYFPPYKFGGIDISPIIVFVLLLFIDTFIVKSLSLYAQQILQQQTLSL